MLETGAWPLEQAHSHNSIATVIDRLSTFRYDPPRHACGDCPDDFEKIVKEAIAITLANFDGLCLDCMDHGHPKTGDVDLDYYNHHLVEDYSRGCRVSHGQSTWYYSFLQRKELMDRYKEDSKKKRSGEI